MAFDIAKNDSCFACPEVFINKVERIMEELTRVNQKGSNENE
jgi:hypothetical protein